jgi:cephalosporin hydroxylase
VSERVAPTIPLFHAEPDDEPVVRRFHDLYYGDPARTWNNTYWRGMRALKCPLDLWIYQEIIFETQPDVIVETGTAHGGGAWFLGDMCELAGNGRVITVDIDADATPEHPRVTYIAGDSVAPETFTQVTDLIALGESVMVVLDSRHLRDHVIKELRLYEALVRKDHYLIVEDTNLNLNPRGHGHGPEPRPGPYEAVLEFLAEQDRFEIDRSREKFFMTQNLNGYLRCIVD